MAVPLARALGLAAAVLALAIPPRARATAAPRAMPGAPADTADSQPAAFDPRSATPYFPPGTPLGGVLADFGLAQWKPAARRCEDAIDRIPWRGKRAVPGLRARAELLCGVADLRAGRPRAALAHFADAERGLTLLAPELALFRAQAALAVGEPEAALRDLGAIPKDSPLIAGAEMLRIEALRSAGRDEEAAAALRTWIAAHPSSPRLPEARLDLALSLLHARREGAGRDAIAALLRAVLVESPLAPEAGEAAKLFRKLTGAAPVFDAPELARRGHAYFDAMRNEEAERIFQGALAAPGLTPAVECDARYHLAQTVWKERDRPRAAPLFDDAYAACEKARDDDLAMRSAYQAGRCHAAQGDLPGAVSRLLAAAKEFPQHSYADDCLLRAAEIYDDQKDGADAEATLAQIPARFPNGDTVGEALFRIAYRHYKAKDYAGAIVWFDKILARIPYETHYYAQGQAIYWKARALAALGKTGEARAAYEEAAEKYPLSWYALLALNRLRDEDAPAEAAFLKQRTDGGTPAALHFRPRPLFASAGFRRAVELIRLGLGAEARLELAGLGVAPGLVEANASADDVDLLWLATLLYDRAGDYAESHWIPRTRLTEWSRSWPVGENLVRWRLAYPRGYEALVEKRSEASGVPPALLFAIIREESAFDPLTVSFANAIGLTQQVMPTAKRLATKLGIHLTRGVLFDPAKNVPLGAEEIGELLDRYGRSTALAVPAYNAGEGAVDRWLSERGDEPLDEWAEEIPYDETRNYEKRVHASYFAYQFLYGSGDPVPRLDLARPVRAPQ